MIIPAILMCVEIRKHFILNRIYNFRKEVKRTKMKRIKFKNDPIKSTLIGTTSGKKPVYIPNNAKHIFVCGTTGSGKTVALSNFIKTSIDKNYPALIIDGKGDTSDNSMLDIVKKMNINKKVYVINLTQLFSSCKYNPFQNASPTVAKDMLINMTEWSEEHYKLNTERYLQRLVMLLHKGDIKLSFKNIIHYMPITEFLKLSAELMKNEIISKFEHLENTNIAKNSGKIAENAVARFATIQESELGSIFDDNGIDIYTALKEKAIILFILNPLIYPELSTLIGRLIMIDAKKAISKLFSESNERTFFIFDEINVYASPVLVDLVNKSRSANVTSILATQSLSDLDFANGEAFKEQIIENCNNYLVLRQNSSVNAEHWANILGTRSTMEVTYQLQQKGLNTSETGFGSAKRVREYLFHPDDIKTMTTGKGVFLSRDTGQQCKISIHKPF